MVPHFQHVHTAGRQPVGPADPALGLGIAVNRAVHSAAPVAIAVPEGEQAETVGVTSIVGQTFRPQHRQREPATAHRVTQGELDEVVGQSLRLRCLHQLGASPATASGKALGHQERRSRRHIPEHRERAAVVVVAVGDGHGVEAPHPLAGQGGLQQGILVARV